MESGLRLSVVAGIVAAGLAGACREAPAPAVDKSAASSTVAPRSLSVGDLAPEFSLPGSDGKQVQPGSVSRPPGRRARVVLQGVHRRLNGRMQLTP